MKLGKYSLIMGFLAVLGVASPVAAAGKTDASRIVSIGGSVTEIIYMLGASDRIVAVDTTSVFPADALKTKKSVGYMRQISPEGVLSTGPDLVVALEGAGPPQALEVLRESGIAYEKIPNTPNTDGVIEKITKVASLLGKQEQARLEVSRIETELARLEAAKTKIDRRKTVLFLLTAASDRMVAGGTGTSAAGIIELAGGNNAITSFAGYKPVSTEAIIAMKPDAILILNRGGHAADPSVISGNPAFSDLPAVVNKDIFAMDGSLLLGFGPRVVDAGWMLAERLYPNLDRNSKPSQKPATE